MRSRTCVWFAGRTPLANALSSVKRARVYYLIAQSCAAPPSFLSGCRLPWRAVRYWAISDVFEESFFPVHNESFHGMFGLINLHGVPNPSYRAYQVRHSTAHAVLL